jgi:hypothetical protein
MRPSTSHRAARLVLPALALLALAGCQTLNTVSGWLNNRVAFSAPQLQRYLDNGFPREFDQLGGLVSARLSNPRISLPAGDDRLRLDFDVGIGALGGADMRSGRVALASRLRYDPATQGLHLENPELLSVEVPGAGSVLQGGTRQLINSVLVEYARLEPVYRLDSDLLRKLPSGRRIASTRIEDGLVVVRLDSQP